MLHRAKHDTLILLSAQKYLIYNFYKLKNSEFHLYSLIYICIYIYQTHTLIYNIHIGLFQCKHGFRFYYNIYLWLHYSDFLYFSCKPFCDSLILNHVPEVLTFFMCMVVSVLYTYNYCAILM